MTKSNRAAQKLAKTIHDEARRILLRNISGIAERKLDELYSQDAETLKVELRRLFKLSGLPYRQAEKVIDKVFAASREARAKVIQGAIFDAVKNAQGLDAKTFDALFSDEPPPLPDGRPGLRLTETPLPQQASGSEDESA
jgi:hypothetical protein